MKVETVTVGIPVRDLDAAIAWYRVAFNLGEPDQRPLEGLAEYDFGAFWLQLATAPSLAGQEGISVNISVEDATAERARLAELGLTVSELEHFDGVVEFFELTDLDHNKIGFVTELS